jgi:hypothetical protein
MQSNFFDYPVGRMTDAPHEINVYLVEKLALRLLGLGSANTCAAPIFSGFALEPPRAALFKWRQMLIPTTRLLQPRGYRAMLILRAAMPAGSTALGRVTRRLTFR